MRRRTLLELDSVILPIVVVPNLPSCSRVPHYYEHRLLLNLRQDVLKLDREYETIRSLTHGLEVICRYFAHCLPVIHRESNCDPFLEREVLDSSDSSNRFPVRSHLERFDVTIVLCRWSSWEVGKNELDFACLSHRHRWERECFRFVFGLSLNGTSSSRYCRRSLLSEEVLDVFELCVEVNVFGTDRSGWS